MNFELKTFTDEHKELINDRFSALFKEFVPMSGNSNTVHGEILRAVNKIDYRNYNDGDTFWLDYGVETCGSAVAYLVQNYTEIFKPFFDEVFNQKLTSTHDAYSESIIQLKEIALNFFTVHQNAPNHLDMLSYDPIYGMQSCDDCGSYEDDLKSDGMGSSLCSSCIQYEHD